MMVRILLALLLFTGVALAEAPATQPTTGPSKTPAASNPPAATQPADKAKAKKGEFPTPAELVARLKEMQAETDAMPQVAYFSFNQVITEKPADFTLFGDPNGLTLRSVIERLKMARDDDELHAVLVNVSQSAFNLAQAQEVRDALIELRRAGKKTFVYADSYDTIGYTIATGATNICLMEGGEIMIPGVGLETMFVKGLLDKIGVKADFVQVGEYKGADESLTRTASSVEHREELNKIADSLYEQIVNGISLNRNLRTETVKRMIDDALITARVAKERGFVDHLVDQDDLRDLMADELGGQVNLLARYGVEERRNVDLSNPFALFASLMKKPAVSNKPAVALIYAEGMIVDGHSEAGLFGDGGVGSEDIRRAFRMALRDDQIKAVVVRIDSPGGSALASEVMWQAARRVSREKPVIVSIGGMAASGGYYLASAGDYIYADPSAIIGSIGVVGGKFVTTELFDKLGLTTEAFQRGRNADLFSSSKSWDDRQRRMVTAWMKQTYDQFTDRIMTTRDGKIGDIDKVARGRIFLAQQGKELGMIDEIGGLERAINHAADWVGLRDGEFEVRVVPPPMTFADVFMGNSGTEAMSPFQPKITIPADSMLRAMPASTRQMLVRQMRMMQILEARPVMLMTPYVITVR